MFALKNQPLRVSLSLYKLKLCFMTIASDSSFIPVDAFLRLLSVSKMKEKRNVRAEKKEHSETFIFANFAIASFYILNSYIVFG